ncbi:MAG: hypothetical protein GXP54_02985 [Deltaproteobacteria bacterium]|nr:hypothetical protein [Deltaproteobacteria bacterium]
MNKKGQGIWGKFFVAPKKEPSRSAQFEERSRAPVVSAPDPDFKETRRTTTAFIRDAVRQKRFVSVATKLADKGQHQDAGLLAHTALKNGKFEQAIHIYERLGNHEKLAEANYLAARDCQRKGGSNKIVVTRLYAAVQSCSKTLEDGDSDSRLRVLRRMTVISDDLGKALDNIGDLLGAADCYLFCAGIYQNLLPYCRSSEYFPKDPEFFASVGRKVQVSALKARDRYKRHIDESDISPNDDQGKALVAKLRKVNEMLSRGQTAR